VVETLAAAGGVDLGAYLAKTSSTNFGVSEGCPKSAPVNLSIEINLTLVQKVGKVLQHLRSNLLVWDIRLEDCQNIFRQDIGVSI
jgi:hypothetical protein